MGHCNTSVPVSDPEADPLLEKVVQGLADLMADQGLVEPDQYLVVNFFWGPLVRDHYLHVYYAGYLSPVR